MLTKVLLHRIKAEPDISDELNLPTKKTEASNVYNWTQDGRNHLIHQNTRMYTNHYTRDQLIKKLTRK